MLLTLRPVRYAILMVVLGAVGCISSATEPMKEWGAAERYNEFVPDTAMTVVKGPGAITYTAPERGTLYLVDSSDMVTIKESQHPRVIASGLISTGTEVTFDPQQKRAWVKGREGVKFSNVDPSHNYEFRFDPVEKKQQS